MNRIARSIGSYAPVVLALALVGTLISFAIQAHPAYSQSSGVPITGYFWSDTTGWIDLNCSNSSVCGSYPFGLSIDSSGNITGYAWSDNIGWISANPSDLTGCPTSPCTATINGSGVISGWLRAISGNTAQSGGWDGFISLSGTNYGTSITSGNFSGYVWGDINNGWIDTHYAHSTYNTCTASYSCSGNTIQYTNTSCQTSNVTTCVSPNFCSPGSSVCLVPAITFTPSGSFTGHLQVVPLVVHPNGTVKVYWNVANAQSCSVHGTNGDSWSGLTSPTTGATSSAITTATTYTLSCSGYSGATPPSVAETVQVEITPQFQEK